MLKKLQKSRLTAWESKKFRSMEIHQMIISYIKNRSMKIKWDSVLSESYNMQLELPLGAVLGSLSILLFVNDLPDHMSNFRITIFADDTMTTITGN